MAKARTIADLPVGAKDNDLRWQDGYDDGSHERPPVSEHEIYVSGWCTGAMGNQISEAEAIAEYYKARARQGGEVMAASRTVRCGGHTYADVTAAMGKVVVQGGSWNEEFPAAAARLFGEALIASAEESERIASLAESHDGHQG